MKKTLIMLMLSSSVAFAEDSANNAGLDMLATAKSTGNCGIFKLQITFQENTAMTGGNDFLARFWTAEAARLGLTLEQYVTDCHAITSKYNKYKSAFSEK